MFLKRDKPNKLLTSALSKIKSLTTNSIFNSTSKQIYILNQKDLESKTNFNKKNPKSNKDFNSTISLNKSFSLKSYIFNKTTNNFFYNISQRHFSTSTDENLLNNEKNNEAHKKKLAEKLTNLKNFKLEKPAENLMQIYSDSDFILKHLDQSDPDFRHVLEINLFVIASVKDKKNIFELRKQLKENLLNLDEELNLYKALYFNLINIWRIFADLESQQNKVKNESNLLKIVQKNSSGDEAAPKIKKLEKSLNLEIIKEIKAAEGDNEIEAKLNAFENNNNNNNSVKNLDNIKRSFSAVTRDELELNKEGLSSEEKLAKVLPSQTPVKGAKEISESAKGALSSKIIEEKTQNLNNVKAEPLSPLEAHLNEKIEMLNNQIDTKQIGSYEEIKKDHYNHINNNDFYSAGVTANNNNNNFNFNNSGAKEEDDIVNKQADASQRLPVYLEAIRDDIFCNYVYEEFLAEEENANNNKASSGVSAKEKSIFGKHLRKNNSNYVKDLKNGVNRNTSQTEINNDNNSNLEETAEYSFNNNKNTQNNPQHNDNNTKPVIESERILNSFDSDIHSTLENLQITAQDIYKVKKNANSHPKKFKLSQFINTAVTIADTLFENIQSLNSQIKAFPYMLFEVYKISFFHCILFLKDEEKAQATFEKLLCVFKKFSIEAHFEYNFNISVTSSELQKLNKANLIFELLSVLEQKLTISAETSSQDFEKIIELAAFLGNFYVQQFENDKAIYLLQNTLSNLNKLANEEILNSKINQNAKYNSFIKIYRLLANLYGNTNELEKSKLLCMKALEVNSKINDVEFVFNLFDFNYTLASLATRPYLYLQDYVLHFNNIKNLYLQIFEDEPDYNSDADSDSTSLGINKQKQKMKDLVNNNKGMEIFGVKKQIKLESDYESDRGNLHDENLNEISRGVSNKKNNSENKIEDEKYNFKTHENTETEINNYLNSKANSNSINTTHSTSPSYSYSSNDNSENFQKTHTNKNFEMQKNLLNNLINFSEINKKIKSMKQIYTNDAKFEEIKVNILLGYMHLIYVLLRHREHSNEVDPGFENETEENKNILKSIMIKEILDLNEITFTKFFTQKIGLNYVIDWKVVLGEYCFKYGLYEQALLICVDLLTFSYYDPKVKFMIYIDNVVDPVDFLLKRMIELSVYIRTPEVQKAYDNTLNLYEIIKR